MAHVAERQTAPHAKVWIQAEPEKWERRRELRLEDVRSYGEWECPHYRGETPAAGRISFDEGGLLCGRDIVFDFFWLATRQEERHWPRDKHGWLDLEQTELHRERVLRQALATGMACRLETAMAKLGMGPFVARWPDGKQAAACVGHDVDYPEVVRWLEPLRVLRRMGPQGIGAAWSVLTGRRTHWHFSSWVQRERELRTRPAFYFTVRRGSLLQLAMGHPDPFYDVRSKRYRELFGLLADNGAEVGLHASYRAWEDESTLATERQTLEEVSGRAVEGNHHHYLHMDPQDPERTLLLHERVGLKYDATLHHERYIGWRGGQCSPYFPFHQSERRELATLQLPVAWMDIQLFRHREDNQGEACGILDGLTRRALDLGGLLMVVVHDCYFDRVLHPGIADLYWRLWQRIASDSCFWIDTPARIAQHWRERHQAIVRMSHGLADGGGPT